MERARDPGALIQLRMVRALVVVAAIAVTRSAHGQPAMQLTVRNNHEIPFTGAIEMPVNLPAGFYQGGTGYAEVVNGNARIVASLNPGAIMNLVKTRDGKFGSFSGPFGISPEAGRLVMKWSDTRIGSIDLGLAVIAGTSATVDDAVRSYSPMELTWFDHQNGIQTATTKVDGYDISLTASLYGSGMVDVRARIVQSVANAAPAYVALVRRVVAPKTRTPRYRFNGRVMNGGDSPSIWDRDFWYTRGVDWMSWKAGNLSLLSVNGFSPVPTIKRDSAWAEASHFYVWERTRQRGDTTWLISEIAGPNPEQVKSRYMPVSPYAAIRQGDVVSLKWRLAVNPSPLASWPESQLRGFAGYRTLSRTSSGATIELGVPGVSFGTSYFPYSTLAENFDYYRTPGMNSEAFWPISPTMWTGWRAYENRMRSDMHIIRAMGFETVRLHHLELLGRMKREDAIAFLDFFASEARALDLRILVDSEGPDEWILSVVSRYRDLITRVELENEVLIGGIKPSDPARWTSLYNAAKSAAPDAQVFFTAAGNNAMFARLQQLGVPFDRVGLHAYKHGPQWKEAYSSHVLGSAGYASDIGKPITIGEFNWKDLTRMSPEKRKGEVVEIYETVLAPRAIPEFFEFQLQESLTFNPAVSGSNSRHYEPLGQDRRPKPEGLELMRIIRKYSFPTATVREVPVAIGETRVTSDKAIAPFNITNRTTRTLNLEISALAFDGLKSRLRSARLVTLRPGGSLDGSVELELTGDKRPGTYHHFVRAAYDRRQAIGWGVASKRGAPQFSPKSILGDRVIYPQGIDVLNKIDWTQPIAVAYGATSGVLELECAHQLATTLQSATGRTVRVSSVADLPDSIVRRGLVILVGTPSTNTMIPAVKLPGVAGSRPGAGLIWLNSANRRSSLVLGGPDAKAAQAAVTEVILRFWPNAKDATMRITGMEPGAALGHRAGSGEAVDPP